jgi:two-component system NtrC family sensor kinase
MPITRPAVAVMLLGLNVSAVLSAAASAVGLSVSVGEAGTVGLVAGTAWWVGRRAADAASRCLSEAEERLSTQDVDLARYAAVLSSTDDAVLTLSSDGLITDWNPAATQLFGFSPVEVVGQPVAILGDVAAREVIDALPGVLRGLPAEFEVVQVHEDGATVHTAWILSVVRDRTGAVHGVMGIVRDVGELKAREAELHRESKLESLGRLSAGLAHEINSPIQFVGDNARFLEEAYEELIRVVEVYRGLLDTTSPIGWMERQERMREVEAGIDFDYLEKEIPSAVAQTLEGIDRVATIVRAMKTFSHPGHKEQVPANLTEALEATVTVVRHQISDVADLRLDMADLPPVRCNIADLNQVFLNLVVNAADAIEETGRRGQITVATAVDGTDVLIRVSDTGGGIPDDVRPKIFDPFFTTKDVGRGSGQGLALARGVVQEGHGGALTADSVVGQGTTFTVRIPIDGLPQQVEVGAGQPLAVVAAG